MPGTISDLLPLRVKFNPAVERHGAVTVHTLSPNNVEMNVGIYTPIGQAYTSGGMYFIGGSNSPHSAPAIASGHYLVLYKIDSWESTPRAKGSKLENVRSIQPLFVSISAREYEALHGIMLNPTPENVERARKRVGILLNEVLNNPNHERKVIRLGPLILNLPPQKTYADMLADFLKPSARSREVVPPRH